MIYWNIPQFNIVRNPGYRGVYLSAATRLIVAILDDVNTRWYTFDISLLGFGFRIELERRK